MGRDEAGFAARGCTATTPAGAEAADAEVLLRVADAISEIEALKAERFAGPSVSLRAEFAAAHFKKRLQKRAAIKPGASPRTRG